MKEFEIKLKLKICDISFTIKSDLEEFGLDINSALESWLFRTKAYTKQSFIEYLKRKTPEIKAY